MRAMTLIGFLLTETGADIGNPLIVSHFVPSPVNTPDIQEKPGVPAIGGIGLAMIAIALVLAGCVILRRRDSLVIR